LRDFLIILNKFPTIQPQAFCDA